MRQLLTIRIDPDVLEAARGRAVDENRTLTNYIETVLRLDLGLMVMGAPRRLATLAEPVVPNVSLARTMRPRPAPRRSRAKSR
jgi:hypothetical protein